MDDEGFAAGLFDCFNEGVQEGVVVVFVYPDAAFDGDRDFDGVDHLVDGIADHVRFLHQAGADHAFLYAVGGAAAIQVDFIVAVVFADFCAFG